MRHSSTAIVIASYGQRGILQTEDRELPYILKGRRLRPVCGDSVEWQPSENEGEAVVTAVAERRNQLQRPDQRGKHETLAANLQVLAVVVAPQPKPDFFIADRFLCAAELMGARGILVWNKVDLDVAEPPELAVYERIGYPLLRVSGTTGAGIPQLESEFGAGFGMLVGQSGVGKSSLINRLLDDAGVTTKQLSAATGEGRHTTTASYAHRLKSGGLLIDSPGVRDFAPSISDAAKIQNGFIEILALADSCRFADCTHNREPDCAVKDALERGTIDQRRYDSYKRLRNLAAQTAVRHK